MYIGYWDKYLFIFIYIAIIDAKEIPLKNFGY